MTALTSEPIAAGSDTIPGFHHLGIISRCLEHAVSEYERLGFQFAPLTIPRLPLFRGRDPEPAGVANRCAIFQNNYLEVLGVIDAARWAAIPVEQRGAFDIDAPLRRYEGLHVLHLEAADLDAVRARLLRNHLQPSGIRPYQRLVDTPEGPRMMRARTLSFPDGSNPEALVQIAQHETAELVLQPRYMDHPNGATALAEVIVCAEDPDSVAQKYATYSGRRVQTKGELRIVDLGLSRIIVLRPDDIDLVLPGCVVPALPFLAGFTVTSDLAQTAAALRQRDVEFQFFDGRIVVDARFGCGASVIFESAGHAR